MIQDVFHSLRIGQLHVLKEYLENGGNVNATYTEIPFIAYIHKGHHSKQFRISLLELLIKHNVDINVMIQVGVFAQKYLTPLQFATLNNYQDMIKLLIDAGAKTTEELEDE